MISPRLVSESKVQTLLTLICRVQNVVLLLFLCQSIPSSIADLVPPDIERLDDIKQDDVGRRDTKNDPVTSAVQRLVVFAENVRSSNVTSLNKHVIQGSADSPRAYTVAVLGVPANKDSVTVRVTQKASDESVSNPGRNIARKNDEGENPWEDPDVGEG